MNPSPDPVPDPDHYQSPAITPNTCRVRTSSLSWRSTRTYPWRVRVRVRVRIKVRFRAGSDEFVTEWHGTRHFRCTTLAMIWRGGGMLV